MTDGHTRRLQAILAADVVGYSRLMNRDEEATLARLQALETEVVDPAISGHGGQVVKRLGDGVLAVFPSAVDALRAARAIREQAARQQAGAEAPILYRIGLNVGDVIDTGSDIFGDGVNIASRLEGLADPGGIVVSAAVHDNVRAQDPGPYDDLGERQVKNIEHPVRAYRVHFQDSPPLAAAPGRKVPTVALVAGTLLLVAVALLYLLLRPGDELPVQSAVPETAPSATPDRETAPLSEVPVPVVEPSAPAPIETTPPPVARPAPPTSSTTPSRESTTSETEASTPAPSTASTDAEPPFSERLFDSIAEAVEQELTGAGTATDRPPGRSKVPPGQAKKSKKK